MNSPTNFELKLLGGYLVYTNSEPNAHKEKEFHTACHDSRTKKTKINASGEAKYSSNSELTFGEGLSGMHTSFIL